MLPRTLYDAPSVAVDDTEIVSRLQPSAEFVYVSHANSRVDGQL